MTDPETTTVKDAQGVERTYITTSRGLTLEVEKLRPKATLDTSGQFEKLLIGRAFIESHTIALLNQPSSKTRRVEIQIRAQASEESAKDTADEKSGAGLLEIIYTEHDDEFNQEEGWTFILYVHKEALKNLLDEVTSRQLRKVFINVTPNSFVIDSARQYSSFSMPIDFFALTSISHGELNWLSADGDSIDLREYSDRRTINEKKSEGINAQAPDKKIIEQQMKYTKWIAFSLIALTLVTLFKA